MKVPTTITKPSYVLGIPQSDFRLILAYFIAMFILNNLLQSLGVSLGFYGWLFILLSSWMLFLYLRFGARQNYPGFLSSSLSFRFLQAKKINNASFKL